MIDAWNAPFAAATAVRPLGDGSFIADLPAGWAVGEKPHGGYLLALLTRATLHAAGEPGLDPMAVSAQFLRPPKVGPVLIRTEVLKAGRTVTVLRAILEQRGSACVDTTVTLGTLPGEDVAWSDLPDMPVSPPADAIDPTTTKAQDYFALTDACDVRLAPDNVGFLTGSITEPLRLRMWVKPRVGQPDLLFSLVASDISVPTTFNLGRIGWTPTVQLTALLRSDPAPGWLRLAVDTRAVHGQWFDEDTLVIDSSGRLVCQARQLAITALAP